MGNELSELSAMRMANTKQPTMMSVFSSAESFDLAARMASALAKSTIVPKAYQNNAPNCLIAIEMAWRINTSPMMVMQNLYVVNGTPSWSSQWVIAMINNSRRYKTELKYDMVYDEVGQPVSCVAWAEDYNGNKVVGPKITMQMAIDEGWVAKNGSKWKTMPEVMICYRAASFFGRRNCPDMIMGIYTRDEVLEGVPDSVETVVDDDSKPASQDDRLELMGLINDKFGDKGLDGIQGVKDAILVELGLSSLNSMNVGQFRRAKEMVREMAEADGSAEAPQEKTEE